MPVGLPELVAHVGHAVDLVELGSGSASKTRLLVEALLRRHGQLRFIPVDISRSILEESSLALVEAYDDLEVFAVAGEYHDGLDFLKAEGYSPEYHEYPMGHEINQDVLNDLVPWLKRVLPPGPRK